jgi:hypothetical protein
MYQENFPLPLDCTLLKRGEDPSRMFAGEGGPEHNKAFSLCKRWIATKRLSTTLTV